MDWLWKGWEPRNDKGKEANSGWVVVSEGVGQHSKRFAFGSLA